MNWISVKSKKKPPKDLEVLLYVPVWKKRRNGDGIVIGNYIPSLKVFRPFGSSGWEHAVKFWRYKPNPPKRKRRKQ